jgi:hypothetical protein
LRILMTKGLVQWWRTESPQQRRNMMTSVECFHYWHIIKIWPATESCVHGEKYSSE